MKRKSIRKKDAKQIIKSIASETLNFEDEEGKLSRGSTKQAVEMLYKQLNTAKTGEKFKKAHEIADFILDNTLMEKAIENDALYEDAVNTLGILREYRHSFDLSGMKDEIKYRGRNELNLIWASKNGMNPDKIAMELREQGIQIRESNAIDEFFEIVDRYDEAKNVVEEATAKRALTTVVAPK